MILLLLFLITPVLASPVHKLAPLKSVTITILNKISAKKESVEIPFGSELILDCLRIYPVSCEAIKQTTKKTPFYKASLKIWEKSPNEGSSSLFFQGTIGKCPNGTTDNFDHPVYAVFLERCDFLLNSQK